VSTAIFRLADSSLAQRGIVRLVDAAGDGTVTVELLATGHQ
jgi:hypothetical protein